MVRSLIDMNIEGWNNAFKPISNKYGIDLFGRMHFTVENIRCIVFLIYNNTYTFYDQVGFHVIWCQNYNHKQILLEEKPTCYLQPKRYKLHRLICILKWKVFFQTISPNLVDLISRTYLQTKTTNKSSYLYPTTFTKAQTRYVRTNIIFFH